jgi:hypothetical protein
VTPPQPYGRNGGLSAQSVMTTIVSSVPLLTNVMRQVLATMQQRRPGIHIEAVVPDPANDRFRIYLNKPVASATKVAWFVIR